MSASNYLIDDSDGPVVYGDGAQYEHVIVPTPLGQVEVSLFGTHCYVGLPTNLATGSVPLMLGRKKVALSGSLLSDGSWLSTGITAVRVHAWTLFGRVSEDERGEVMRTVQAAVTDYLCAHPELMSKARLLTAAAKTRVLIDRAECAESDARRYEREAKEALQVARTLREQAAAASTEAYSPLD